MKIEIKVIGGFLPEWSDLGDAGLDLRASEDVCLLPGGKGAVPLGIATSFASTYVALIKDRSSLAAASIYTSAGVIDSGYRGEWKILLRNEGAADFKINRGDRIAQVLFLPILHLNVVETQSLSETARGDGGFGSTGVQ